MEADVTVMKLRSFMLLFSASYRRTHDKNEWSSQSVSALHHACQMWCAWL